MARKLVYLASSRVSQMSDRRPSAQMFDILVFEYLGDETETFL
jgi:hypothetical protein